MCKSVQPKPVSTPMYEQETSISYIRSESFAYIYSSIPSEIRKYLSLITQHPEHFILIEHSESPPSVLLKAPNNLVTVRKPRKPLTLTPEQLAKRKLHAQKLSSYKRKESQ